MLPEAGVYDRVPKQSLHISARSVGNGCAMLRTGRWLSAGLLLQGARQPVQRQEVRAMEAVYTKGGVAVEQETRCACL